MKITIIIIGICLSGPALYAYSFPLLGLKVLLDKNNNNEERIKNTLWRKNIIHYNPNNYYTTTPNIKYKFN